jgi:hypothetical protein
LSNFNCFFIGFFFTKIEKYYQILSYLKDFYSCNFSCDIEQNVWILVKSWRRIFFSVINLRSVWLNSCRLKINFFSSCFILSINSVTLSRIIFVISFDCRTFSSWFFIFSTKNNFYIIFHFYFYFLPSFAINFSVSCCVSFNFTQIYLQNSS